MKKKLIALLLSGCLIFSIVGCGSEEKQTVTESSEVSVEVSTPSSENTEESITTEETSEESTATSIEEVSEEASSEESVSESSDENNDRAFRFPEIFSMEFDIGASVGMDLPYEIKCISNQKTGEFITSYQSLAKPELSLEMAVCGEYVYLSLGDTKVFTKNTDELDSMNNELAMSDEMLDDGTRYEKDNEVTENGVSYITYKMFNPDNEGTSADGILYVNKATKIIERFDIIEEEVSTTCYIIALDDFTFTTDGYTECDEDKFTEAFLAGMFSIAFSAMDGMDFNDED